MLITSHPIFALTLRSANISDVTDRSLPQCVMNIISLCKRQLRVSCVCQFPSVFRIECRTYARITSKRREKKERKENLSSSLDTITQLAIRQRSSAHVNPFKAARARLYVAASRERRVRQPCRKLHLLCLLSLSQLPIFLSLCLSLFLSHFRVRAFRLRSPTSRSSRNGEIII